MEFPVYCLHCEEFVEPKVVRPGSSGVTFVLAGLAALFGLPALANGSVGSVSLLSLIFGAACAVYVAWRHPARNRVCGMCGSPYIIEDEDQVSFLRHAA